MKTLKTDTKTPVLQAVILNKCLFNVSELWDVLGKEHPDN